CGEFAAQRSALGVDGLGAVVARSDTGTRTTEAVGSAAEQSKPRWGTGGVVHSDESLVVKRTAAGDCRRLVATRCTRSLSCVTRGHRPRRSHVNLVGRSASVGAARQRAR